MHTVRKTVCQADVPAKMLGRPGWCKCHNLQELWSGTKQQLATQYRFTAQSRTWLCLANFAIRVIAQCVTSPGSAISKITSTCRVNRQYSISNHLRIREIKRHLRIREIKRQQTQDCDCNPKHYYTQLATHLINSILEHHCHNAVFSLVIQNTFCMICNRHSVQRGLSHLANAT